MSDPVDTASAPEPLDPAPTSTPDAGLEVGVPLTGEAPADAIGTPVDVVSPLVVGADVAPLTVPEKALDPEKAAALTELVNALTSTDALGGEIDGAVGVVDAESEDVAAKKAADLQAIAETHDEENAERIAEAAKLAEAKAAEEADAAKVAAEAAAKLAEERKVVGAELAANATGKAELLADVKRLPTVVVDVITELRVYAPARLRWLSNRFLKPGTYLLPGDWSRADTHGRDRRQRGTLYDTVVHQESSTFPAPPADQLLWLSTDVPRKLNPADEVPVPAAEEPVAPEVIEPIATDGETIAAAAHGKLAPTAAELTLKAAQRAQFTQAPPPNLIQEN